MAGPHPMPSTVATRPMKSVNGSTPTEVVYDGGAFVIWRCQDGVHLVRAGDCPLWGRVLLVVLLGIPVAGFGAMFGFVLVQSIVALVAAPFDPTLFYPLALGLCGVAFAIVFEWLILTGYARTLMIIPAGDQPLVVRKLLWRTLRVPADSVRAVEAKGVYGSKHDTASVRLVYMSGNKEKKRTIWWKTAKSVQAGVEAALPHATALARVLDAPVVKSPDE